MGECRLQALPRDQRRDSRALRLPLPRTAPPTTVLQAQAECLRVFSDGALHVNTMREPVFVAMDFVVRQHWPLAFQDSDGRAFQQPAFGCVPESTIVRAFHREIFPSNHAL